MPSDGEDLDDQDEESKTSSNGSDTSSDTSRSSSGSGEEEYQELFKEIIGEVRQRISEVARPKFLGVTIEAGFKLEQEYQKFSQARRDEMKAAISKLRMLEP